MRISDEVAKAVPDIFISDDGDDFATLKYIDRKHIAKNVIQAYLSDIWKPFDAEDENTWPSHNHRYYLVKTNHIGKVVLDLWRKPTKTNKWHWWERGNRNVTHYCNPADILPKEDK